VGTWRKVAVQIGISRQEQTLMEAAFRYWIYASFLSMIMRLHYTYCIR
jgi:hypothetical protein